MNNATNSQNIEILVLSHEDTIAVGLNMSKVLKILEDLFMKHYRNEVICPDKIVLDLGEREKGRINSMPAYVGGDVNICSIKWISGFPNNPQKYNLPRACGVIILNDAETGLPVAFMEGTYISAMRTGGVSGLGAKYLARKGSEIVGIIGCSVQAKTQLLAILEAVESIKTIRLYDINMDAAKKLASWVENYFELEVVVCGTAEQCVLGTDIIATVTTADLPIVKGAWLKPGSLLIHVGSFREQDDDAILNADKIFVDDWEHVLHRGTQTLALLYKQGKISLSRISGELKDIVSSAKLGRATDDERIFFTPIGLGTEDAAVAHYVYKTAQNEGLGTKVTIRETEITYDELLAKKHD